MPNMKTIGTMKFANVPEFFLRLAAVRRRLVAVAFVFRKGVFCVAIIFIHLSNKEEVGCKKAQDTQKVFLRLLRFFAALSFFQNFQNFIRKPRNASRAQRYHQIARLQFLDDLCGGIFDFADITRVFVTIFFDVLG